MKIICVNWIDAASTYGWQKPVDYLGLTACESVGYLIHEDKFQIQLAQSIGENDMLADIISIPKNNITHRRILEGNHIKAKVVGAALKKKNK